MAVLAFPVIAPSTRAARTLAELEAMRKTGRRMSCEVIVTKDDRERRYVIWSDAPNHWIGEVWLGRCRHRRRAQFGPHEAKVTAMQFVRELRDLLADGWMEQVP